MKHLVTSILLFLSISIIAQYHHAIGLQLTGQYYFDGRKFYFHRYPNNIRFPGINYTYYIDKKNIHSLKLSYEKMIFKYNFKIQEGDVYLRSIQEFALNYGYQILKYKNFSFNSYLSLLLLNYKEISFNYIFLNKREIVFNGYQKKIFGNEIGISFNYFVLNQLNLSSYISFSKLYDKNINSNLLQCGFSTSYKF